MSAVRPVRPVNTIRFKWWQVKSQKTFWLMLKEVSRGQYRMSALTLLLFIAAVSYVIAPNDLIPDSKFIVGWLDDALVLCLLAKRLLFETHRFNRFKAMERKNPANTAI
jgi:uncharacterized membrane protein YkvA (DUF1232 family)